MACSQNESESNFLVEVGHFWSFSVFTGSEWKMTQWHCNWKDIKHLYMDWYFKSKWAKCFLYRWGLGENAKVIKLIFLIFLKHIGKKSSVPLWTFPPCSSNLIVRRKNIFPWIEILGSTAHFRLSLQFIYSSAAPCFSRNICRNWTDCVLSLSLNSFFIAC